MDLPDKLGLSSFCNIIMIFINLSIESNEYLTNLFFLKWNTIYNYILKFQTNIDFLSGFIKSKISNAHLYKYWNYQRHNATWLLFSWTIINQPDKEKNHLTALQDKHNDIRFRNDRLYLQSKAHSELLL